jgi:hypothetical protein
MAEFRDFLQGMSNSAASTVSAPVDGLAWLLKKAGVSMGAPVGGSDWMAAQGLTAEPQNRNMGLLGEAIGGISPILAAAKAPQIAKGLLAGADNLMAPATLNKQAGLIGRGLSRDEAMALVAGKTEKPGGVNPAAWISDTDKKMTYGRIRLDEVKANEAGALYDGTVDAKRAADYASRPASNDAPPVLLMIGKRTNGMMNVLDGGHRVTAARMRGDEYIPAIVMDSR